MDFWQILAVCGIGFLILEIFTPSMFFLNFALASFITAVLSIYFKNPYILAIVFVILSFISFIFLRPLVVRVKNSSKETGIEDKYIGKTVKADVEITSSSGVVSIYGERWEARTEGDLVIPLGADVKIVRFDNIVMYVEQV